MAGLGVVTTAAGLLLGLAEITGLGLTLVLVVVFASLSTAARRVRIATRREPGAPRIVVDQTLSVAVTVTNTGRRPGPALGVRDPVGYPDGGRSTARVTVPALAAGSTASTTYLVRVRRRGRCTIGPMELVATDPFGLTRRIVRGPAAQTVTVLPDIVTVAPPRIPVDTDEHPSPGASSDVGSEFASLRDYVDGDDLRRVHWRTSARRDELVVRSDEQPRLQGCTVVLDVRAVVHDTESFEHAVSIAASIVVAAAADRQPTRLCTTAGFDSAKAPTRTRTDVGLGSLAVVEPGPERIDLPTFGPDPVLLVTSPSGQVSLVDRLGGGGKGTSTARSSPVAMVIVCGPGAEDGGAVSFGPGTGITGAPVLRVRDVDDFATRWNRRFPSTASVGGVAAGVAW